MRKELWPYQEARRILKTFPSADTITLESGYGPSGAPHIGTFAEVARTGWVARALEDLSGRSWRLVAFSDDMDGLRKVPLNMPAEKLEPHLGKPLSHVPDPFHCHASYAAHNNALLRSMLDRFGFKYTFKSSHEQYTSGEFNEGLERIMSNYEAVRRVILPTMREEKRADWSPFFPICEKCGRVNGTRVTSHDPRALTVSFVCEGEQAGALAGADSRGQAGTGRRGCGHSGTVSILNGAVKVGWKVDWALRWYVLGVHYEMYGKDLIESAALSAEVCKIISGKKGPVQSFYEMFLDEDGRKISKSVGKGLTVERWLDYAPKESLLWFIFKDPRKAKRLSWDAVSRAADDYLRMLRRHYREKAEAGAPRDELGFIQPDLPADCPYDYPVTYSMLLGLIGAIGLPAPEVVMEYVHRYNDAIASSDAMLVSLIEQATAHVRDRKLSDHAPLRLDASQARLIRALADYLHAEGRPVIPRAPEEIQSKAFEIAREGNIEAGEFFRLVYRVLTGQDSGPRLGNFVKLMGQGKVAVLLRNAIG